MKKAKVLFFSADPHSVSGGNRLQLDAEVREIRQKVSTASHRDDLDFDAHWAARPGDLLQALDETRPRVVHFSGHCGDAGLVLVGAQASRGQHVGASALAKLFGMYRGDIRVVVLNACLSLPQAEAIAEVVGCAIGTQSEITDAAAITFSSTFYQAIASGKSVQSAFDKARLALALDHFHEQDCPQLVVRPGVDATKLFVVEPGPDPRRKWAGVAAVGLVTVLAGVNLIGGGGEGPFAACAWAGAPPAPTAQPVSLMAGPSGVLSDLDRAKADYEAGRYAAAFPRFRRLAENENLEAMRFVGAMFLRGHGTAAYPDSGIYWLRQAAYKRDPQAMTMLGAAYENGEGVKHSLSRAREWYHKAADEKHWAEAMRSLGTHYRRQQNHASALTWFQNAVKAGSLEARIDAGQLYEQGHGTPRDMEEAVCLYRTAADGGSLRGMLIMGGMYRNGIGVDRDPGEAKEWYEKAARAGSPEAMRALKEL